MIKIKREGVLLEKTANEFENGGVLNPAVIAQDNMLHMFYRAVGEHNQSSIGYCRLDGAMQVVERKAESLLSPQYGYESQGMEDPRIVQIDGLYYLTYTAYDGNNAVGALATSKDMVHWERQGIITPQLSFDDFRELSAGIKNMSDKYFQFDSRQEAESNQPGNM